MVEIPVKTRSDHGKRRWRQPRRTLFGLSCRLSQCAGGCSAVRGNDQLLHRLVVAVRAQERRAHGGINGTDANRGSRTRIAVSNKFGVALPSGFLRTPARRPEDGSIRSWLAPNDALVRLRQNYPK